MPIRFGYLSTAIELSPRQLSPIPGMEGLFSMSASHFQKIYVSFPLYKRGL